ncbi:histidine--tRNA ligase [Terricaulis silvestris]|uniref:Histidine--tRNA ligase n=1 Tax=Terricaulis silvestris TaxID=2686094 RepID=A0A6I6MT21_9CAUL|nr:histidine--tRNA ligase [Terricaulis silvestris]QGZ94283.1 Histidine--tRNA ligase [Terricaulis silvestris]
MSNSESSRVAAEKPRGFADRLGKAASAEERVVEAVGRVYEQWGFDRLETPALEFTEALGKFLPDLDRPNEGVFSFKDDERWLSLRYDLTAPLARFAAEQWQTLPKPFRRWAGGPVWRNEKPGPGRFREFWQCDADTVGSASPAADAEIVALACAAVEAAGVARGNYVVKVSSRKLLDGLLELVGVPQSAQSQRLVVLRALDKLDRLGAECVRALLGPGRKDESGDFTQGAKLEAAQIEPILKFATASAETPTPDRILGLWNEVSPDFKVAPDSIADAGVKELAQIFGLLQTMGYLDGRVQLDTSVVRGLEYYTGPVFEAQLIGGGGANFGSVGGGGRYDDLVARFTGERVPATGFSIGVSRLAAVKERLGWGEVVAANAPVVVLALDGDRIGDYFGIAQELRDVGIRAEVYLGGAGMKAQLKYADKRDAPIVVIQGGDELAKGTVTLKDLKLGAQLAKDLGEDREAYAKSREQAQREVPRGEVVAAVQQMLAR